MSFSNGTGFSAPQGEMFEGSQVVDRVSLQSLTGGRRSTEHEPKTAKTPGLHVCKDEASSKEIAPAFQPSAESLSIFDEAKKQCEGQGRTRSVLCGSLGLRGPKEDGTKGQSKHHAPKFQPSAESLSIFDEAKKQCDEGGKLPRGLKRLDTNAAREVATALEDRGSKVTSSVIAASLGTLREDQISIDVVAEEGLNLEANDRKIQSRDDGNLDAAAWCALVRQHQNRAHYLKSSNGRAFFEAKRRRQQPFTPRDRYRSPPRRSIASACWESWCLDEKTAARIRKELQNGEHKRKDEASLPGRLGKYLASAYRKVSRRLFSWLSSKIDNLLKSVCKIAKWIVGVKI